MLVMVQDDHGTFVSFEFQLAIYFRYPTEFPRLLADNWCRLLIRHIFLECYKCHSTQHTVADHRSSWYVLFVSSGSWPRFELEHEPGHPMLLVALHRNLEVSSQAYIAAGADILGPAVDLGSGLDAGLALLESRCIGPVVEPCSQKVGVVQDECWLALVLVHSEVVGSAGKEQGAAEMPMADSRQNVADHDWDCCSEEDS